VNTFTFFIVSERSARDYTPTTYITSVSGSSEADCRARALAECASSWDTPASSLEILGVAQGDVDILEWNDEVL
jgi:hypothetical protein